MSSLKKEEKDRVPEGIVFYTDGSARPNPGYNGSGIHGYTYVYSDKPSRSGNAYATDIGYVENIRDHKGVEIIDYLDSYYANSIPSSNNVAEINAVRIAIETFKDMILSVKKVHFNLDSQYVLNAITDWMGKWKSSGWVTSTGKPVANQEELMSLDRALSEIKQHVTITYAWVQGHVGDIGNTRADLLALLGAIKSQRQEHSEYFHDITPRTQYMKTEDDLHPLLALKRLYFNSYRDYNEPNRFFMTGWTDKDFIVGKRKADAIFGVLDLHTPDKVLNEIIESQYTTDSEYNHIVYARLDKLKLSTIYPYVHKFGSDCLFENKKERSISFLDNTPIISDVTPGELPMRSMETLNTLESILDKFKSEYLVDKAFKEDPYKYVAMDITDLFYKKGKLLTNLKPNTTEVVYNFTPSNNKKPIKLKLILGEDLPNRNTLKRLESIETSIYLLTWEESPLSLRYAVAITTNDATMLWSNYFANQILL